MRARARASGSTAGLPHELNKEVVPHFVLFSRLAAHRLGLRRGDLDLLCNSNQVVDVGLLLVRARLRRGKQFGRLSLGGFGLGNEEGPLYIDRGRMLIQGPGLGLQRRALRAALELVTRRAWLCEVGPM